MSRTFRMGSSVTASVAVALGLTVLHEGCTGTVLSPIDAGHTAPQETSTRDVPVADAPDSGLDAAGDAPPTDGPHGGGCDSLAGKLARWAAMDKTPFRPWHYAGLDLGTTEAGITLDEAELINCAGDPIDASVFGHFLFRAALEDGGTCDQCGHCYGAITWGSSQEVSFFYNTASSEVAGLYLNAGYTGALRFKSAPGQFTTTYEYVVRVGSPITRNGVPFVLNWTDMNPHGSLQELYNGMMAEFSPGYKYSAGYDCWQDEECLYFPSYQGHSYFGFDRLQLFIEFKTGTSVVTQIISYGAGRAIEKFAQDAGYVVLNDAGNPVAICDAGGKD